MTVKRILFLAWIPLLIIGFDLITKWLTQFYLPFSYGEQIYPYGGVGVFSLHFAGIQFAIIHNINYGAAWGLFGHWQTALLAIRIGLIIGLCIYLWKNSNRLWDIPLLMIISGALGNVLDYFIYGHVIDMFQFVFWRYHYPTFNVADSAIFIGIASLFALKSRKVQQKSL